MTNLRTFNSYFLIPLFSNILILHIIFFLK